MSRIDKYDEARGVGLDHEAARKIAAIPKPTEYASLVARGCPKGEAAAAVGYKGAAGERARETADMALTLARAAEGVGATAWLCPEHYRAKRAALESTCLELRLKEEACLALALAQHPTWRASDGTEDTKCAEIKAQCGSDEGE